MTGKSAVGDGSYRVENGALSDGARPAVPGNGVGAVANGTSGANRIDLVRTADGLTPPDPAGLLRPISPARVRGSRRQRHEEARAARAEDLAAPASAAEAELRPVADVGEANGDGPAPDLLEWAELKLPPVEGEEGQPSPYEGLPPEPIAYGDDPVPAAAGAEVAAVVGPDGVGADEEPDDIPVLLEEEPGAPSTGVDGWETAVVPPEPEPEPPAAPAEAVQPTDADQPEADESATDLPDLEQPTEDRPTAAPAAEATEEAVPALIVPAPPDPSPFGASPIAAAAPDAERPVATAPPQPPAAFALGASAAPAPEAAPSEPAAPAQPPLPPLPPPLSAVDPLPAEPPLPPPPSADPAPVATEAALPPPRPAAFTPPPAEPTLPPPPAAFAPPSIEPALPPPDDVAPAPPPPDAPVAPAPPFEPAAFDAGPPPPAPGYEPLAEEAFDDETGLGDHDDEAADQELIDHELVGYGDEEEESAFPPAALELRQIAGLTAGIDLELDRAGHEFAEGDQSVAFTITVDDKDRAVLVPGTMAVKLDTLPVAEPTLIGWGALDVGSARFVVRPRRSFPRADEWLAQRDAFDRPELEIEVPPTLGVQVAAPADTDRGRRRFGRRRAGEGEIPAETLNAESWEFIDRIRSARADLADRERYLHPDPAELVVRTRSRAPILGIRPPGHPLFGKVGVIVADMPWMPNFDDIRAIPDSLGPYLQPLMSLPSIPIAADLLVGPLGIVGSRAAAAACARHIILSLHALSTPDLRVHIAASPERAPVWDWAYDLAVHDEIDLDHGFPVVVVDGIENFGRYGLTHADAIEHRVGVVILTDSIDDLPNYCGSVLQVDRSGSALLTNHLGHVIAGTPVGVANDFARHLADDLNALYRQRR